MVKDFDNWEILSIEDKESFARLKTPEGVPWWFYLRLFYFRFYLPGKLQQGEIISSRRPINLKAIKFLVFATVYNITHRKSKETPIIFHVSSRPAQNNGRYYNIYAEELYKIFASKSIIYENAPVNWMWPFPRNHSNYKFYAPQLALSSIFAKRSVSPTSELKHLIRDLCNQTKDILNLLVTDQERDLLEKIALENYLQYNRYSDWLISECEKRKCKLLIMDDAFAPERVEIILKARKLGILVADLQHGAFVWGNFAYCYSPEFLKYGEVERCSPDFFLSYGEWWNHQTNIPFKKKIVIGYPHRQFLLSRIEEHGGERLILLIGEAHGTEKYFVLAQKIADKFKGYRVVFRPHPIERLHAQEIGFKFPDVNLDIDGDLYNELARCIVVISEMSTVLFEAVGLSKRILVWRTSYSKKWMPENPFEEFSNFNDLCKKMESKIVASFNTSLYWDNNYKQNYSTFIQAYKVVSVNSPLI